MKNLVKDMAFVGIGGCGTNIAFLFEKAGYTTVHINSSQQDENAIKGAKNIKHLNGFNGCAGNRKLAAKAMAKNIEIVDDLLNLEEEFIVIAFGAGGGTGSGIAPVLAAMLCEEAEDKGIQKTVCCICVLPDKEEDLGFHQNAYNASKELLDIDDLGSVLFIDNNYNSKKSTINMRIFNLLNSFITNNSVSDVGNVDEEEKRTMLRSHGTMVLSCLSSDRANSEKVLETLTTENIFAPTEGDGNVEYIAIINSDNKGIKKEELFKVLGIPRRTFVGYGSKDTIVAASGLTFPLKHLKSLAELAKEKNDERKSSRKKIEMDLDDLDLDDDIPVKKQKKVEKEEKKKKSTRAMLMDLDD